MELRLVLTVDDWDAAVALYRDALGLREREMWLGEGDAKGVLLDAGEATLEVVNEGHAASIDEIEVGRRIAPKVRVAFRVDDSDASAERLEAAGARRIAGPVVTPWQDKNVRLEAPDGTQLTLFSVVD
ncbi:MAG TPA: VOC family protein [Gaiellaceae bacterium]|nr:VOC family protein [Gaiellaceae bacterium]